MTQVHSFNAQNDYSKDLSDEAFWFKAYKSFFPDLLSISPFVPSVEAQKLGVDRVLVLITGQELRVDEKKRPKTYFDKDSNPEILLEYVSNDTTGSPGWIEKALHIDYVACAFMDTQTVYMLPWHALRRVWQGNGKGWKRKYGTVPAQNEGYKTLSVPVPVPELYRAIGAACRVPVVQIVK